MDSQTLINYIIALVGFLGGWVLKVLWDSISELRAVDSSLIDKVAAIEVMVAGSYITRDEFQRRLLHCLLS